MEASLSAGGGTDDLDPVGEEVRAVDQQLLVSFAGPEGEELVAASEQLALPEVTRHHVAFGVEEDVPRTERCSSIPSDRHHRQVVLGAGIIRSLVRRAAEDENLERR